MGEKLQSHTCESVCVCLEERVRLYLLFTGAAFHRFISVFFFKDGSFFFAVKNTGEKFEFSKNKQIKKNDRIRLKKLKSSR